MLFLDNTQQVACHSRTSLYSHHGQSSHLAVKDDSAE